MHSNEDDGQAVEHVARRRGGAARTRQARDAWWALPVRGERPAREPPPDYRAQHEARILAEQSRVESEMRRLGIYHEKRHGRPEAQPGGHRYREKMRRLAALTGPAAVGDGDRAG